MDWFIPETPNGRAILFIHGGGWNAGSKAQWHAVAESFACLGYTCASAEYRLVPDAVFEDQIADVRLAMSHMRTKAAEHRYQQNCITALGSSAGGHLVAMLATISAADPLGITRELTHPNTRPECAVCYCPVLSFCDNGPITGYFSDSVRALLGGDSATMPARFHSASPINRITGDEPPFLFIHGDADETVPLRHSTEMHRLLLEAGVSSRLVVLPEVGHGFGYGVRTPTQLLAIKHIQRYLAFLFGI